MTGSGATASTCRSPAICAERHTSPNHERSLRAVLAAALTGDAFAGSVAGRGSITVYAFSPGMTNLQPVAGLRLDVGRVVPGGPLLLQLSDLGLLLGHLERSAAICCCWAR